MLDIGRQVEANWPHVNQPDSKKNTVSRCGSHDSHDTPTGAPALDLTGTLNTESGNLIINAAVRSAHRDTKNHQ